METFDHSYFQTYFEESIAKLSTDLKIIEIENDLSAADYLDAAKAQIDSELNLKLHSRRRHLIFKMQEALLRVKEGTFGECRDCGERIELSRLMARPTAEICVQCKEAEEQGEHHIPYAKRSHTLGKMLQVSSF